LDPGEKISTELVTFEKFKDLVDNRVGFLGNADLITKGITSLEKLMTLPEFRGREIER
jgi:hypothetical protein